eukprot:TRINITY_DN8835_c0_g1_i2.p1 TRINITY_DN8835_c0_g1~~TRINITY_DN8835_c0_g1_i2.p1  ORF type:complete len:322 (+),score=107.27 TRINITY_DN8835_c0_g1_i2:49-1014(+)
MAETPLPTYQTVLDARQITSKYCHLTPVFTSSTLDTKAGRHLHFKCENFQKVGAFKFRGASNVVFSLPEELAKKGVVTHSSGNHGQALALAAKMRGIPAYIVMPNNSPSVKKAAVEGYGATVILCEPNQQARESTCERIVKETGGTMVHPYNDPRVISGQGTLALELLEQVPNLDAIIVPVGGGGMVSGVCLAARGVKPGIRIFAAEPKGADDAARSMQAGEWVPQTNPNTVADGLKTSLGSITWPIIRDNVEKVFTVSEEEIIAAMRLVWERMKLVIEPSAAVGVAVALSDEFRQLPGLANVGVVICGGNIDLDKWKWSL